jgi:hypothetical protein
MARRVVTLPGDSPVVDGCTMRLGYIFLQEATVSENPQGWIYFINTVILFKC